MTSIVSHCMNSKHTSNCQISRQWKWSLKNLKYLKLQSITHYGNKCILLSIQVNIMHNKFGHFNVFQLLHNTQCLLRVKNILPVTLPSTENQEQTDHITILANPNLLTFNPQHTVKIKVKGQSLQTMRLKTSKQTDGHDLLHNLPC